tara:strand:- start:110 stop:439 length:330 start_codon:yes stop_codon:yes gene_type:complete
MKNIKDFIKKLSGRTTSHSHKFSDWKEKQPDGINSVSKVTVLHTQHSDCPVEVEEEVISIWKEEGFHNDVYFKKTFLDDCLLEKYPNIYMWLLHKGVKKEEEFWIHWWW